MNTGTAGLVSYWTAGGAVMIPLGAVCFLIWRRFLRSRLDLSAELREAAAVENAVPVALRTGSWKGAADALAAEGGPLTRRFAAALADAASGAAPSNALLACEESEMKRLGEGTGMLSALTVTAPLLGLLGTVIGMVQTFRAVGGTGDLTSGVAEGISRALITTQFGLIVAIPGVFGAVHVRRLLRQARVRLARCRVLILIEAGRNGMDGGILIENAA